MAEYLAYFVQKLYVLGGLYAKSRFVIFFLYLRGKEIWNLVSTVTNIAKRTGIQPCCHIVFLLVFGLCRDEMMKQVPEMDGPFVKAPPSRVEGPPANSD